MNLIARRTVASLLILAAAISAGFFFFPTPKPAYSQAAGAIESIYPLTRDLGARITLTAQGAAPNTPVVSADQNGFNVSRVVCVFNQTTYTGSPSVTFAIQNKDKVSGNYYTLVTSAATTTALNTPVYVAAGADLPNSSNLTQGAPIAQTWRVIATAGTGSSTPVSTGTVGCSVQ